MSFLNRGACSFTAISVGKNAPEASGVYGLSNSHEWLLVGEGNDIRALLLQHLSESGTALKTSHPTGFTYELCGPGDRVRRKAALVQELRPSCNASSPAARAPSLSARWA